jgi:hypothetical protein
MNIGYARVSTTDQNLDLQTDALAKAGCEKIFTDVASGAKADRVGLAESMGFARTGDTLVVWKLDRLGRSLPHLIATVRELESKGIGFRSVQEAIDTTSPAGKLFFHKLLFHSMNPERLYQKSALRSAFQKRRCIEICQPPIKLRPANNSQFPFPEIAKQARC